ncbi:chromosome segregation protein SMC [Ornithinimicrobium sp. Arc0846-15]|nr:chromosome segregation protein SMC [Ornithinimicrobium laminariae]
MYVKSLTLKGFKSFASATTMRLEPGITCIVGPNGSGKSNVVDALAWVMGEQGAKSLRGGKMEDVIFAGTTGRPPLGRAEVSLTIDNTDGALPIDYSEVTITRTMFRSGGSDYAINGTSARLLDVQELLADSGIGREMHVIVGQGQLDQVLRATPEERRGFIEEASGVLKHRKRKERALRKLDAMESNLTRLADLTTEIRRQLGPLGRQAETARRAGSIQATVRDARLRLLADDLVQMTSALAAELADKKAMLTKQTAARQQLDAGRLSLSELEDLNAAAAPDLDDAQQRWYALSSLVERVRSTADLAAERVRLHNAEADEEASNTKRGRDPEELRDQAANMRDQEAEIHQRIERLQGDLEGAGLRRAEAEKAFQAEQNRLAQLARAAADRREGLAKLAGQVAASRSRVEAGDAEVGRLGEAVAAASERASKAEREFAALEATILDVEQGEEGLDAAFEKAQSARAAAEAAVEQLKGQRRAALDQQTGLRSRCEALALNLQRKDGTEALAASGLDTVKGKLARALKVEPGFEGQVAAALDWAAEAVLVTEAGGAASALSWLRSTDAGQAGVVFADGATRIPEGFGGLNNPRPSLPEGARWALDVVSLQPELAPVLETLLAHTVLQGDDSPAQGLIADLDSPHVRVVTPQGDVYGRGWARGGSSTAPSTIEVQASLDAAKDELDRITGEVERLGFELQKATDTLRELAESEDRALDQLHNSDAKMTAIAEQLGQWGSAMRDAAADRDRNQATIGVAQAALEDKLRTLAELEQRLANANEEPAPDEESDTGRKDELAELAALARTQETEARLALRTQEERVRAISGRADGLEAAAKHEQVSQERAAAKRKRREASVAAAIAVTRGAKYVAEQAEVLVEAAVRRRDELASEQAQRHHELTERRAGLRDLEDRLRQLTDTVHQDDVARAEQRLRIKSLQQKAVDEWGMNAEQLMDEFGPHLPIPAIPSPQDPEGEAEPEHFVRAEQEKRLRKAERQLNALGKVNPLALEEFTALEERYNFLNAQVEDLRQSKADLLEIVREVDDRVERVFTEAFADTAEQFEGVFSRLFPGGAGRLVLTDPDNMLTTGIEVEGRPPGKKIKRLSLLSGGERSLTAVALLVAIFKARPSPFYIMDEVEAALDDTNLGRLITLFEELRDSSQLIVITHQKRTMEIADALYGVTMQGDGVTTVISQRLRENHNVEPQSEQLAESTG